MLVQLLNRGGVRLCDVPVALPFIRVPIPKRWSLAKYEPTPQPSKVEYPTRDYRRVGMFSYEEIEP